MADAPLILGDADFRRQIKNSPAAGYLLFGEEDYLKAAAVTLARRTIIPDPTFAPFNEILLDALSYTPDDLRRAFTAVPMMADRKLILLRGLDFTSMRPSEFDALCRALDELSDTDDTTLLIPVAAGAIDEGYLPKRPSAQLSRLCANLTPVRFTKCTPEKLRLWCARHFEHNGAAATPAICDELIRSRPRSTRSATTHSRTAGRTLPKRTLPPPRRPWRSMTRSPLPTPSWSRTLPRRSPFSPI